MTTWGLCMTLATATTPRAHAQPLGHTSIRPLSLAHTRAMSHSTIAALLRPLAKEAGYDVQAVSWEDCTRGLHGRRPLHVGQQHHQRACGGRHQGHDLHGALGELQRAHRLREGLRGCGCRRQRGALHHQEPALGVAVGLHEALRPLRQARGCARGLLAAGGTAGRRRVHPPTGGVRQGGNPVHHQCLRLRLTGPNQPAEHAAVLHGAGHLALCARRRPGEQPRPADRAARRHHGVELAQGQGVGVQRRRREGDRGDARGRAGPGLRSLHVHRPQDPRPQVQRLHDGAAAAQADRGGSLPRHGLPLWKVAGAAAAVDTKGACSVAVAGTTAASGPARPAASRLEADSTRTASPPRIPTRSRPRRRPGPIFKKYYFIAFFCYCFYLGLCMLGT